MVLRCCLVCSWNDFYSSPSSPSSLFEKSRYESTKNASSGSQYVYLCFFIDCSAEKGGGILVTYDTNLLVEETSFNSCKATSGNGGGLFFEATGNSILYKVCSYQCEAASHGLFCYMKLPDSLSYNNTIKDSSASYSNCPSCYRTLYPYYGKIHVSSLNSSKNVALYFSGILVYSASSSSFSDCLISYSCFSDNEAKNDACVFYTRTGKGEMRYCNVIRNQQVKKSSRGIVATNVPLNIYDSYIVENDADRSIYSNGSTVNVYNTTFDKSKGSGVIVQSTPSSSVLNYLRFIKTAECDAEIPIKPRIFTKHFVKSVTDGLTMIKLTSIILHCE